ncbi:hypothetical protein PR202_ga01554 [Eleusine coracana subsp. coracana]|uniref:Acetate--CoA ligase n=1 Tax=Eleusine coracana subsp. coracana TaxID=191504 RepID=A0AAV5BHM2_ELECO|nr:hypothetical protein PR202_ga00867 [Eleusine coracana subsp. coracana]GJM85758.1 hypothetical protein PR202_ga01554 [Eleusine coracana subsp. coracana]
MGTANGDQPAGTSSDKLRHVESMSQLPSGAGKISGINALVLGESLAAEEHDLIFPSHEFSASALVSSPKQYREMYERSIKDPAGFWSEIADTFYWKEKWNPSEVCLENLDVTKGPVQISWFKGGKTNICYNAVDRNIEAGNGDKVAMLWEGNELGQDGKLTYSELLEKLANYLKSVGVGKGDAVVIYLPMLLELPIAMLACARIGAIHSVVFAGFSADSLAQRIVDCKPKLVLTCNAVKRGVKPIFLKDIVDAALVESEKNGDVVSKFPTKCDVEWVDTEDPLFLLYTSGSTGKPKTPNYPDSGRCWDIVDKYSVTIFYTAPTLVRSLMRDGTEYVTRYSRKSLRVLGSVGEPINPSAWRWFYNNVVGDSRCPISDTWWQTETGGFMITPLPGAWPQKPGSATFPFFGVQPVIVDEKGQEIEGECSGYLCIKKSWPGAFRTLYGDHERYETTYFKPFAGYYFTGDGCSRDKDGYHWLTGRVDDVINVSGHRIGTAEVESALVSHSQCAEAAVVGVEHEVKGQGIYAFVTLVDGVPYSEELRKSLIMTVRNQIGAFAAPDKIHWAPGLPKTRSGKIMRRILRKIAARQLDELGDTSTLADPGVVNQLIALSDC